MKRSAGILLYRWRDQTLELLLVHPGGPFWAKKDAGAWSIPKGEYEDGEDPLVVAKREFEEELGAAVPEGPIIDLGALAQPSRKLVVAFALEGDFDPEKVSSNLFDIEWPPKSGQRQSFPESIAPNGLGWTRRASRCCRDKPPSSTACWQNCAASAAGARCCLTLRQQ